LSLLEEKKILITGGTGSLGRALTARLLKYDVKVIRIYSRDEAKQIAMEAQFRDSRLRFLIGDIRDKDRLRRAMEDIDVVFHTAALKQVPVAEYNPMEAVKTNVYGAQNLIEACLDEEVEIALAVGTDKAVSPLNTYGATKLLMEKLFTAANFFKGNRKTIFTCVRYGNVLGSRGSVVPRLLEQVAKEGKISLTNPEMTRFNITMDEALDLILNSIKICKGAEAFVPKLKAYRLIDLASAIIEVLGDNVTIEKIPIRPGEKMHETLINENEARNTLEIKDFYVIIPSPEICQLFGINNTYSDAKKATLNGAYSSDKVPLMSKEELKKLLESEHLIQRELKNLLVGDYTSDASS